MGGSVMQRLKSETSDLHSAAERHPFQQSLLRGTVSREAYAQWLGQMLLIHRALEAHLRRLAPRFPSVASVLRDYQFQEPYLLGDLAFLGVEARSVAPLPAAARLMSRIDSDAHEHPLSLLGMHYVLEGSNNGSRYIAKSIRRALGLQAQGVAYLDPYGEEQPARWAQFKADMDAAGFSGPEEDSLVAGAGAMFQAVWELSEDLMQSSPA